MKEVPEKRAAAVFSRAVAGPANSAYSCGAAFAGPMALDKPGWNFARERTVFVPKTHFYLEDGTVPQGMDSGPRKRQILRRRQNLRRGSHG